MAGEIDAQGGDVGRIDTGDARGLAQGHGAQTGEFFPGFLAADVVPSIYHSEDVVRTSSPCAITDENAALDKVIDITERGVW